MGIMLRMNIRKKRKRDKKKHTLIHLDFKTCRYQAKIK